MNFKSQICTDINQSRKLLELGLKKETADMVYHYQKSRTEAMQWELRPHPPVLRSNCHFNIERLNVLKQKNSDGVVMSGEEYFDVLWGNDIPAWSMHRLIELMYKGDMFGFVSLTTHNRNIDTIYELVIANIEGLIKIEKFNKDYLEEQK